jgi:hypothetical protein
MPWVHLGPFYCLSHQIDRFSCFVRLLLHGFEQVELLGRHYHQEAAAMPGNLNWFP